MPSYGISFFKGLKYCSYRYFARTQFLYGIFWMALGVAWIYLPPIHFDMEMSRQNCDREISLKAWNWRGDSYLARHILSLNNHFLPVEFVYNRKIEENIVLFAYFLQVKFKLFKINLTSHQYIEFHFILKNISLSHH